MLPLVAFLRSDREERIHWLPNMYPSHCFFWSFLLPTLHTHKWRYKICICSVIEGDFESFRNFKGFSIIFPKTVDAIHRFTNVRIFLIPISITFLNPEILGFLFLRKRALLEEWIVKIKLQKIVGNLLDTKFRKLYMNGTVI